MRKLWMLVLLLACFGLSVPGCSDAGDDPPPVEDSKKDDTKKDDAKKDDMKKDDATTKPK